MNGKPADFNRRGPFLAGTLAGTLGVCILAAALSSCGDKGAPKPNAEIPGDGAVFTSPDGTVLTGQKAVRLSRMKIMDTLEVPVRIDLDERRSVLITAPAAGRLEEVFIRSPDQAVKAGDPIASLFSPELATAQREYLMLGAQAGSALLDDAAARLKRMGMTSRRIREIRRSGKPMERIPITAPKAGFVVSSTAIVPGIGAMGGMGNKGSGSGSMGGMDDGAGNGAGTPTDRPASPQGMDPGQGGIKEGIYVERGTPLATLNDLSVVAASLALPMELAALFQQGDSIHLSIPSADFSAMARLEYLESRVADTNRVLTAKAYVSNPGAKLKAGILGQAHLTPTLDSVWALPRTAVHNLGEKWIVWSRLQKDSTAYQAREVRLGRRGRHHVEITQGLIPGEAVAETASLLVDPDAAIDPLPLAETLPTGDPPAHTDSHSETAGDQSHNSHSETAEGESHDSHGSGAHAKDTSTLTIPTHQEVLAGIRTETVRVNRLTPSTVFRATTRFDDRAGENVPTRVEGTIEQVRIRRAGERVSKGQVLAEIRSDALLAAQQEFLLALSQTKSLPDRDMARSQIQAARRRLKLFGMSEGEIDASAKRGKNPSRLSIFSPKSGIVLAVNIQQGQYVREGESLFIVGGSDRIWVETWMLPKEMAAFPQGSPARVEIEGIQGEPIPGVLEHVGQGTVVSGALAIAHVGIPNTDGKILPGLQAWVTLSEQGRYAPSIPPSALLESSNSIMAWVRVAPNRYAPRMVKAGLRTPTSVEILAGLKEGDEVVIAGAYLLQSEWIIRQGAVQGHAGH